MLFVAGMLEQGTLLAVLRRQLWNTQVPWAHYSPVVLPVLAGLQYLLGPRFGLPTLGGALMRGLSVGLAWMLGRRVRAQTFGLLFAAPTPAGGWVSPGAGGMGWLELMAERTERIIYEDRATSQSLLCS